MSLEIRDLSFDYPHKSVLEAVSLSVADGSFTALLGPNGSGKSTLAKVVARVHKPRGGSVFAGERDLLALSRRAHAKIVAYVPQAAPVPFEMTVRESVLLGRTPYIGLRPTRQDWRIVDLAMAQLGLGELSDQPLSQLSGGQAQRALIARALAQEPEVLILDEPTSALDLRYQVETLDIVRRATRQRGVSALIAIHDLNHAIAYCDHLVLLHGGRIVASGSAEEVCNPETLETAYGLPVEVSRMGERVTVFPLDRG